MCENSLHDITKSNFGCYYAAFDRCHFLSKLNFTAIMTIHKATESLKFGADGFIITRHFC